MIWLAYPYLQLLNQYKPDIGQLCPDCYSCEERIKAGYETIYNDEHMDQLMDQWMIESLTDLIRHAYTLMEKIMLI